MGAHGHTGRSFPKSRAFSEDKAPARARSRPSWGVAAEQEAQDKKRSPGHKQHRRAGRRVQGRASPSSERAGAHGPTGRCGLRLSTHSSQQLPCSPVTPGSLRTSSKARRLPELRAAVRPGRGRADGCAQEAASLSSRPAAWVEQGLFLILNCVLGPHESPAQCGDDGHCPRCLVEPPLDRGQRKAPDRAAQPPSPAQPGPAVLLSRLVRLT